jgi:hypothetical protein
MNEYEKFVDEFVKLCEHFVAGSENRLLATHAALYDIKEDMDKIYSTLLKELKTAVDNNDRELFMDIIADLKSRYEHIKLHCEDAISEIEGDKDLW